MRLVGLFVGLLVVIVAIAPARADEVFLTSAQTPAALFGEGATAHSAEIVLTDSELSTVSQRVQKRVEQRSYASLDVSDRNGAPLGRVVILDVVGQSLPIQFAVGIRPDGTVQDVQVMVYREPHGSEIREHRFRAQFTGKSGKDPLVLGKDIDAISGATISSQSAAYAVRKALAISEVLSARAKGP